MVAERSREIEHRLNEVIVAGQHAMQVRIGRVQPAAPGIKRILTDGSARVEAHAHCRANAIRLQALHQLNTLP